MTARSGRRNVNCGEDCWAVVVCFLDDGTNATLAAANKETVTLPGYQGATTGGREREQILLWRHREDHHHRTDLIRRVR